MERERNVIYAQDVARMVQQYYAKPGNEAGGNFHIVLDDGNLRKPDIQWAIDRSVAAGDVDGVNLGEALLSISRTQLKKLYKRGWK